MLVGGGLLVAAGIMVPGQCLPSRHKTATSSPHCGRCWRGPGCSHSCTVIILPPAQKYSWPVLFCFNSTQSFYCAVYRQTAVYFKVYLSLCGEFSLTTAAVRELCAHWNLVLTFKNDNFKCLKCKNCSNNQVYIFFYNCMFWLFVLILC